MLVHFYIVFASESNIIFNETFKRVNVFNMNIIICSIRVSKTRIGKKHVKKFLIVS